jgi:hypothetical protein
MVDSLLGSNVTWFVIDGRVRKIRKEHTSAPRGIVRRVTACGNLKPLLGEETLPGLSIFS